MGEPWHYDATEGNPRGKRSTRDANATAVRFKFNMWRALNVDDRLTPSSFKVASALLTCLNSENGDLYPSIVVLSDMTCLSRRSVRYCLEQLRDTGWITWNRGNRQKANFYQFDDSNLDTMLRKLSELEAARRDNKAERRRNPEGQPIATPERQLVATQ